MVAIYFLSATKFSHLWWSILLVYVVFTNKTLHFLNISLNLATWTMLILRFENSIFGVITSWTGRNLGLSGQVTENKRLDISAVSCMSYSWIIINIIPFFISFLLLMPSPPMGAGGIMFLGCLSVCVCARMRASRKSMLNTAFHKPLGTISPNLHLWCTWERRKFVWILRSKSHRSRLNNTTISGQESRGLRVGGSAPSSSRFLPCDCM